MPRLPRSLPLPLAISPLSLLGLHILGWAEMPLGGVCQGFPDVLSTQPEQCWVPSQPRHRCLA